LPTNIQENLKPVQKLSDNGYYDTARTLTTTYDKIFVPSLEELNIFNSRYTTLGQGTPYVLFTDDYSRKIETEYWTRSTSKLSFHAFVTIPNVESSASINTSGGGNIQTVVFCFCI
jgi:hypothetical protein